MLMRLIVCLILLPGVIFADENDPYFDRPQPGEEFKYFFMRITNGGTIPGIKLEAPASLQSQFFKFIYRPTWNSAVDKARAELIAEGVNLWQDWYVNENVLTLLTDDHATEDILAQSYKDLVHQSSECLSRCAPYSQLKLKKWSEFNIGEIHALAMAYVIAAPLFSGKTILECLAEEYQIDPKDLSSASEYKLLHQADFEFALREIGWDGPIYFRGITAPDPKNPNHRKILINADLVQKMTPFGAPILQFFEHVGILTHELSHVSQDLQARQMGIDLTLKNFEGLLLIEGAAEFLAEKSLLRAYNARRGVSPLRLFVAEQGSEIVYRPGQAQQGNLYPYTVGLPFAAALFSIEKFDPMELKREIIRVINDDISLRDMLFKNFTAPL